MSARASRPSSHLDWWLYAGVVVGIPYVIVFVFGYESWIGRLIASAYFWVVGFVMTCALLVFVPSERLITPNAKLRRLKSHTPRRVVEIVIRTLGVGLALYAIINLINCSLDTSEVLSRHGPPTISGKLTDQRYTALAWVCDQNITILRPDGSSESYSLFFHPRVPIGRTCKFRILPRCKGVLSIEVSD
jgi:hypothetical protein